MKMMTMKILGGMDMGGRERGHVPIQFRLLCCYVPHCQFVKEERETVRRCEICMSYYQMRSVACSTVDSKPLEATYGTERQCFTML
jgi:hypothetical protein